MSTKPVVGSDISLQLGTALNASRKLCSFVAGYATEESVTMSKATYVVTRAIATITFPAALFITAVGDMIDYAACWKAGVKSTNSHDYQSRKAALIDALEKCPRNAALGKTNFSSVDSGNSNDNDAERRVAAFKAAALDLAACVAQKGSKLSAKDQVALNKFAIADVKKLAAAVVPGAKTDAVEKVLSTSFAIAHANNVSDLKTVEAVEKHAEELANGIAKDIFTKDQIVAQILSGMKKRDVAADDKVKAAETELARVNGLKTSDKEVNKLIKDIEAAKKAEQGKFNAKAKELARVTKKIADNSTNFQKLNARIGELTAMVTPSEAEQAELTKKLEERERVRAKLAELNKSKPEVDKALKHAEVALYYFGEKLENPTKLLDNLKKQNSEHVELLKRIAASTETTTSTDYLRI